jgi:hypothetical protein
LIPAFCLTRVFERRDETEKKRPENQKIIAMTPAKRFDLFRKTSQSFLQNNTMTRTNHCDLPEISIRSLQTPA